MAQKEKSEKIVFNKAISRKDDAWLRSMVKKARITPFKKGVKQVEEKVLAITPTPDGKMDITTDKATYKGCVITKMTTPLMNNSAVVETNVEMVEIKK